MADRSADLGPGTMLGPYRLLRRLGAGGMGAVFEATDEVLGRRVAIKVIAPSLARDPAFRRRFVNEARAQASLDSPHVVQVFAHGEIDDHLYLAAQLVPDGDLGALLRKHGPLSLPAAVDVTAQVAAGLAEAHRVGLVHRDIKPGNVLLRRTGDRIVAYLCDFGIATGPGDSIEVGHCPPGTPAYMAPEVVAGGAGGPAADVYALGCLLFAALTGGPPADGGPAVLSHGPMRRDVSRILAHATAADPEDRPTAARLCSLLRSVPVAPGRTVGTRSDRRRFWRVRRGATVALAVAVGALIGPTQATSVDRQQRAITNIGAALSAGDDIDARTATCVARRLVEARGVERLIEAGYLSPHLTVGSTTVAEDRRLLAATFEAAFACTFGE